MKDFKYDEFGIYFISVMGGKLKFRIYWLGLWLIFLNFFFKDFMFLVI